MGLYLLCPLLVLGIVESQTANVTDELSKVEQKLRFQLDNQTFSVSAEENSTINAGNASLSKDELSEIKEELEEHNNQTVITEDDEKFQELENEFLGHCQEKVLVEGSHVYCGAQFYEEMLAISRENWCVLEDIIRPYNDMTICLERLSNILGCFYPNQKIQEFFLEIHSHYFQNCSKEELVLVDAPQGLVLTLTLIPVSLIPVLVYLVVRKSKEQD